MINHLRWKLTAFNTCITGAILVALTLLCLFVSEKDTRNRAFQNFTSTLSTASVYLGSQNRISVTWLRQMENTGRVCISIRDGDTPLFSMGLSEEERGQEENYQQARERAQTDFRLSTRTGGSCTFPMKGRDGQNYFAGVALISKGEQALELVFLYPLAELEQGILRQRMVVGAGLGIGLVLLWVFSWCFTGKMLRPIQESHQRQTRFTAAASHELRTPLAAILSAASAMEGADPAQQARFSDMIRREGQRMTRLIGDMLTLTSADNQSWDIRPEPVEPDMLLLDVYETYLPLAREKGLNLFLSLPEELGQKGSWDRERIVQVLSILLDNAMSYTPAPGDIRLELCWGRGCARIRVSDTGPGVPDQEKNRIFQRFHRGEKARSHRGHFGLGLSIAWEIVKFHRGKLWVEDAPGGGAAFVLELPVS